VTYFPERQIVRIAKRRRAKRAPALSIGHWTLNSVGPRASAQMSCPRRGTARTIMGTVSSSSHYPDVCQNFLKSNPCAAESGQAWCVRELTPSIFDVQICAGRFHVVSLRA